MVPRDLNRLIEAGLARKRRYESDLPGMCGPDGCVYGTDASASESDGDR